MGCARLQFFSMKYRTLLRNLSPLVLLPIAILTVACGDDGEKTLDAAPTSDGETSIDAGVVDAFPAALAAVSGLQGNIVSFSQADLRWTDNSDDETGFRVERSASGADSFVELSTLAADTASYSDTTATGGSFDYRVVATKDALEAQPSNVLKLHLPVAPQTATLVINPTTLEVTVSEQPDNLTISVANNATWAGVGTPLRFSVRAQNDFNRLVFNLKAVVTSVSEGTTLDATGQYDGNSYYYYGQSGIDLAASKSVDVAFDGITGTGDVTVNLSFVNHMLYLATTDYYGGQLWAYDSGGTEQAMELNFNQFGNAGTYTTTTSNGNSAPMESVVSSDGRFAYFGVRNQPTVVVLDTVSMTMTEGPDLVGADNILHDGTGMGSIGFTRGLMMSPDDEFLYVILMSNAHNYECSITGFEALAGTVELVKLERTTLAEVGRSVLLSGISSAQGRRAGLSTDGSRVAVSIKIYDSSYGEPVADVHGKIFVVNTSDMSIVDGDSATAGNQAFDVIAHGAEVNRAAIAPGGNTVYALSRGLFYSVDLGTGDTALIDPPMDSPLSLGAKEMNFGPDGRLYGSTNSGNFIYDTALNTYDSVDDTANTFGVHFPAVGDSYFWMFAGTRPGLRWRQLSDDQVIDNPATGTGDMIAPGADEGHASLMTPF